MLSQILSHPCNVGYEPPTFGSQQVDSVNGTKVMNVRHLMETIESCRAAFVTLRLVSQKIIVLATKDAKQATQEVLKVHNIAHNKSVDLRD